MTAYMVVALVCMCVGFGLGAAAGRAKLATCVVHAYRALQLVRREQTTSPQTAAIVNDAIQLIEDNA